MSKIPEVIINGVLYVPAEQAMPALQEIKAYFAHLVTGSFDSCTDEFYISVTDTPPDSEFPADHHYNADCEFNKIFDELATYLAKKGKVEGY